MVDLEEGEISLHEPKISGAFILINLDAFNPGCRVAGLNNLQELRGRINRWPRAGYTWRRLTEPINRLMAHTDISGIWIRCDDWWKWQSFWAVVQFVREISADFEPCGTLSPGSFSGSVGVARELTAPHPSRTCNWSSGDATTQPNWRGELAF